MNWSHYVDQDGAFNIARFTQDTKMAIRFLDDVLDVNQFALEDNRQASAELRRLGLGLMGLSDALIKMGLSYGTPEAREMVYELAGIQARAALEASQELAQERGVFPLMKRYPERFKNIQPRRNVAFLTVAPTGTTAMAFACSSGIEPIYSLVIYRKVGSEYITVIHPLFKEMLERHNPTETYVTFDETGMEVWNWDKLIEDLSKHEGSCQTLDLPEAIRKVFVVAHDVDPLDHVRMQGTVQRAFDDHSELGGNSLSKTINMSNSATVEQVEEAYLLAFQEGCKGITVYRDGSREFQVLSTSKAEESGNTETKTETKHEGPCPKCEEREAIRKRELQPRVRPERLYGFTDALDTADGKLYVTLNYDQEGPREVVAAIGKGGGVLQSLVEGHGRLISMALQYGVPLEEIIHKLRGIRGGNPYGFGPKQILSIPDAIGKALAAAPVSLGEVMAGPVVDAIQEGLESLQVETVPVKTDKVVPISEARKIELDPVADLGKSPECSECGQRLVYAENCLSCPTCGISRCG